MLHPPRRVPPLSWLALNLAACILTLIPALPGAAQSQPDRSALAMGMLTYHQLTDLAISTGSVGFPVLSADGTTGVFVDAPGTGDPATPNRISTIDVASRAIAEVDAYQTRCFCGSMVDLSGDGTKVVSTEGVQLRIADAGGARELVVLASGEITAVVIAGDGATVFFLVRRDTATADGATLLPRGVWAIDVDGTELRQVVGAEAIADAMGVPVDQTGCCVHADGHPLAVSDSGGQVVFGAYAEDGEHIFAVDGNGGNLHVLRESLHYAMRVSISGDGTTVAYDVLPLGASVNELASLPFAGGSPQVYAVPPATEFRDSLQLSADGSQLLVSPNGLLIDTGSGDARTLATPIPGLGGSQEAVITDGLPRATMDAEGERVLYVMRTTRCADCVNLPEQLATLEIDPTDWGEAPAITDATIEPAEIGLAGASAATVTATVEGPHPVLGVGVAALLPGGVVDANVGHGRTLLDDGQDGDARAGDGVYTAAGIVHGDFVLRDDDTGPRTVRIAAEVEDGNGLRHATAVEIGMLTVVGP
jgi:hypothetical protein